MWFKSAKEFKENIMILVTIARFTTYSFKGMERAINHNEREKFVDDFLSEPIIKPIKIKIPKEVMELQQILNQLWRLSYYN